MRLSKNYFIRSLKNFLIKDPLGLLFLLTARRRPSFSLMRKNSNLKTLPLRPALFLNQKGISTIAPVLLSLSFSLAVLYTYKAIRINQMVRERKQIYLCLKETDALKRSYISKMANLNKVIHGAFLARAIPAISIYAQRVQKAAQYLQQFLHFAEMKNAMDSKRCSSLVLVNYIRTLPYKTKGVRLLRRLDGTAPIKKKSWKEYLWSENKLIFLQSSQELKSRFATDLKSHRREFSKEALQNLRGSYGALFSFSY